MNPADPRIDRRGARRIQMGCKARLKVLISGELFYGECIELSVHGLSVRTAFVPQFGESVEIVLMVAGMGALPAAPLYLVAEVRRCNEVVLGRLYDIGFAIVERKACSA
ncbi:PilZ domain-containing protein [Aquitalea sp. S1-19]|nr:PilZ domain-containing protein [Aquitalea sp. S1-19]